MPVPVLFEVAEIDEHTPLDLWGGWGGELDALYLSTGSRQGGASKIFRHLDENGDGDWKDDEAPSGPETYNKIRDDGLRLYAWCEHSGETSFLLSRSFTEPGWSSEGLPGYVGGRALDVGPGRDLVAGGSTSASASPALEGKLYAGPSGGPYGEIREITPGLLWEVEREGDDHDGALWEFWGGYVSAEPVTFRDDVEVENPSNWAASANWFDGAMYACGELREGSPSVFRWTGTGWETVLTMSRAHMADHILRIPRDPPELWAIGNDPFQVYVSLDGTAWEELAVPDIETDADTNQLTAVAYFKERVWVATRDRDRNTIRLFVDQIRDLFLQVI